MKKENRRLQSAFLQNVFLQARVDTLQWQVKQVRNRAIAEDLQKKKRLITWPTGLPRSGYSISHHVTTGRHTIGYFSFLMIYTIFVDLIFLILFVHYHFMNELTRMHYTIYLLIAVNIEFALIAPQILGKVL